MRIQRLPFIEPVDVKFASLPDGRLSLLVLQKSGVDNVPVYVWRNNFLQFQLITTVRVPGAQDFQRLANPILMFYLPCRLSLLSQTAV